MRIDVLDWECVALGFVPLGFFVRTVEIDRDLSRPNQCARNELSRIVCPILVVAPTFHSGYFEAERSTLAMTDGEPTQVRDFCLMH